MYQKKENFSDSTEHSRKKSLVNVVLSKTIHASIGKATFRIYIVENSYIDTLT